MRAWYRSWEIEESITWARAGVDNESASGLTCRTTHGPAGWPAPPPLTNNAIIKTSQQPRAHAYGPLSLHVPLVLLAVGWARRPWEGRPCRVQFVFAMALQLCSIRNCKERVLYLFLLTHFTIKNSFYWYMFFQKSYFTKLKIKY